MSVRRARSRPRQPLTCNDAARAASCDLDGRLSQRERLRLRTHLRNCEQCVDFLHAVRIQRVALRRLTVVSLPVTLRTFDRKVWRPAASP